MDHDLMCNQTGGGVGGESTFFRYQPALDFSRGAALGYETCTILPLSLPKPQTHSTVQKLSGTWATTVGRCCCCAPPAGLPAPAWVEEEAVAAAQRLLASALPTRDASLPLTFISKRESGDSVVEEEAESPPGVMTSNPSRSCPLARTWMSAAGRQRRERGTSER